MTEAVVYSGFVEAIPLLITHTLFSLIWRGLSLFMARWIYSEKIDGILVRLLSYAELVECMG